MILENITNFNLEELSKFEKIFCLVSGGIDSTYLYELIKERFNDKCIPVNCFNPFENSDTLDIIKKDKNFIQIKSKKELNYKKILMKAFLNIPKAIELRKEGKYTKNVFCCCRLIKHKTFFKSKIFLEKNSVVISGIKPKDSSQRFLWLNSLKTGKVATKGTNPSISHFYRRKTGQLYCYPYRDYNFYELPEKITNQLKQKYPSLTHSGCKICPVLVVYKDRKGIQKEKRLIPSLKYWNNLIIENKIDFKYFTDLEKF